MFLTFYNSIQPNNSVLVIKTVLTLCDRIKITQSKIRLVKKLGLKTRDPHFSEKWSIINLLVKYARSQSDRLSHGWLLVWNPYSFLQTKRYGSRVLSNFGISNFYFILAHCVRKPHHAEWMIIMNAMPFPSILVINFSLLHT